MSYSHDTSDADACKTNIYRFEQTTCISYEFWILFGLIDDYTDGRPSALHYKGALQDDFVLCVVVDSELSVQCDKAE
jgi:hypothetical protein